MPWVRSIVDNVLKRLWAANAYMITDQLFTLIGPVLWLFPPLKKVGEGPGKCEVLEDILSSVPQRRGEVWRIASARSNSRPLSTRTVAIFPSSWSVDWFIKTFFLGFFAFWELCSTRTVAIFSSSWPRQVGWWQNKPCLTETEMLLPKGKSLESVSQNSNPT